MHFWRSVASCRKRFGRHHIRLFHWVPEGEILALKWSQVDLAEPPVRLEPGETKNDEGRAIPLVADLYGVLKIQKETRDQCLPDSPGVSLRPIVDSSSSRTPGKRRARLLVRWMKPAHPPGCFMTSNGRASET